MKYFKDILKILLFVTINYVPILIWSTHDDLKDIEKKANNETILRINSLKTIINSLIREGRILEACQRLASERNSETIFLYSLKSEEASCQEPETIRQNISNIDMDRIIKGENVYGKFFIYENKFKDVDWTVRANVREVTLLNFKKSEESSILIFSFVKNLSFVLYIVLVFAFLAVLILSKSIQNQFRKNGEDPAWLKFIIISFGWLQLHDLKILKSATGAMLRKSEVLAKDQDLLETSLEFSILNEIKKNNHHIPYSFRGTVAKVDINGFSKTVSVGGGKDSQNLTKFLEDFGCELLQRYQGLFEKTVGDEIVVVFKTLDSALLATAFARDLMAEFSQLDFDVQGEKRRFTLKSSISSSELTFSKRAPGYGFLGDALTYTTRLLDVVYIKDRNILSCLKSQASEITSLVNVPEDVKNFEFKNMAAAEGYLIDQFVRLADIYDARPDLIKYFRSNDAILFLLDKVKTETDFGKLNFIFVNFYDSAIRQTNAAVISAWISALKAFEKRVAEDPNLSFSFSRLIVEGSRLIPAHQWTPVCTEAIVSISRYIEGRINASVVDVLIEKDLNLIVIDQEKSFIIEDDQSFRTRGNLLINQAIHQLSNSVLENVIKMIYSKNALESSTGIYCACRIIIYYRKKNPAELETFMSYRKLSKVLHELYLNKHKDVSPRLLKLLDQVNSYNELTYQQVAP